MSARGDFDYAIGLAGRISGDLAEFAIPHDSLMTNAGRASDEEVLTPGDALLAEFDRSVLDPDLRAAARSRFATKHYADAVEAGVKSLNECIRARTGRTEDGDALMTIAFSPKDPLLRVTRGRSKSDESAQRGHMFLCQGVVSAWRNPRAHSNIADTPERSLVMLATINELIEISKSATRTRKRKTP